MKQKELLYISISFFIVVIAWIGFNIYHQSATSTISDTLSIQIKPISPRFNTAVIDDLKSRQNIPPLYNLPSQQRASSTPSGITAIPTPILNIPLPSSTSAASPSAQNTISITPTP